MISVNLCYIKSLLPIKYFTKPVIWLYFSLSLFSCNVQKLDQKFQTDASWDQKRQQKRLLRRQDQIRQQFGGLNSLIGTTKHSLILQNGPPGNTSSDGAGGEVLTYSNSMTRGTYLYGLYLQNTIVEFIQIYCDSQGKIYTWRAN